jgi:hypothetical protein
MEKYCWAGQATDDAYGAYGAYALHAGYLKLQTHARSVHYLLLFHGNSGCTNALQRYAYMYIACLVII